MFHSVDAGRNKLWSVNRRCTLKMQLNPLSVYVLLDGARLIRFLGGDCQSYDLREQVALTIVSIPYLAGADCRCVIAKFAVTAGKVLQG